MPYIKRSDREQLAYKNRYADTAGELNYEITMINKHYLSRKGESYQTYNDIVGALTCAKDELYRRKIIPYENKKIKENSDVY